MLKGIAACISPALLQVLSEMGCGDTLVLAGANFPAAACAKETILLRADGVGTLPLLEGILKLLPLDENVTPSAVSLVWDFMTRQPNFALVPKQRQKELAELVEMIRAYDTWDFQNDKNMSYEERKAADELNQLFWFFPLSKSKSFVDSVFASGWEKYRIEHELLISTLEGRRQRYLDKHLKNVETFEIEGHGFGVVYASDYKSEIAHELLKKYDVDAALVIDSHSVSLRSNGRLDVAKFAEDYFRGGGHADSAGGRLEVEPIKAAEQAVIESVKQRAKLNEEVASQNEDETSSLGDSLDPEMAAKLASLFGNDGK